MLLHLSEYATKLDLSSLNARDWFRQEVGKPMEIPLAPLRDSSEDNIEQLNAELLETFNVNVIGVATTITAFLPLVKKSKTKKVITISTGMADLDFVNQSGVAMAPPYSASKAATNILIAKYNVSYRSQGILFMAVSPGFVDTSEGKQSKFS